MYEGMKINLVSVSWSNHRFEIESFQLYPMTAWALVTKCINFPPQVSLLTASVSQIMSKKEHKRVVRILVPILEKKEKKITFVA